MTELKDSFFRYNSRPGSGPFQLSPYFTFRLDQAIERGDIAYNQDKLINTIISNIADYRIKHNISHNTEG